MACAGLRVRSCTLLLLALSALTVLPAGGCTEPSSPTYEPPGAYYGPIPAEVRLAGGLDATHVRVGLFARVSEGLLLRPDPDALGEYRDVRVRVSQPDGGRIRVWVLDEAGQPDETAQEGIASIEPQFPVGSSIGTLEVELPSYESTGGPQTYALIAWYDEDGDGALDLGLDEDGEQARAFTCTHDDRDLTLTDIELSGESYGDEAVTTGVWRLLALDASGMLRVEDEWPETWVAELDAATEPPLE